MHPIFRSPLGDIPAYPLFVALAFASAALVTWLRHRHEGFHFETVFSLTVATGVAGMIGARVWFVATHPSLYAPWFRAFPHAGMDLPAGLAVAAAAAVLLAFFARAAVKGYPIPLALLLLASVCGIAGLFGARIAALHQSLPQTDPFAPQGGGFAFFGALLFAVPAILQTARHNGIPPSAAADAIAPGALLACAIGRVGCFLNGCCGGIACSGAPRGQLPTQLIESAATLGLAVVVSRARFTAPGHLAAASALGYAAIRASLEFLRAPDEPSFAGVTPTFAAALALAALAAALLLRHPAPRIA